MYIVSTASFLSSNEPVSLCVFGKRQLFRMQLRAEVKYPLKVKYMNKTPQTEVRQEKTMETLKIALTAEPMESDLKDRENFSFLGLH